MELGLDHQNHDKDGPLGLNSRMVILIYIYIYTHTHAFSRMDARIMIHASP